jgi:hypothetical protein
MNPPAIPLLCPIIPLALIMIGITLCDPATCHATPTPTGGIGLGLGNGSDANEDIARQIMDSATQEPQQTQISNGDNTDTIRPIEPPFGLDWGENPTNIRIWAQTNKYPISEGNGHDGRYAMEIDGPFPNAQYNRLRFYFVNERLIEVEIQFNEVGPPNNKKQKLGTYGKALALKQHIDSQLGEGTMIKNEKGKKGDIEFEFIEQIWTDEEHAIWLAVYNAEDPNHGTVSMASIHYRWEGRPITDRYLKQPLTPATTAGATAKATMNPSATPAKKSPSKKQKKTKTPVPIDQENKEGGDGGDNPPIQQSPKKSVKDSGGHAVKSSPV